jgi:DNA-binding beta-propeller fold protein YncE
MSDLDERFRRLERMTGPDLWPDIEGRVPRSMPDPGPGRKMAVAAVAMLLAAGGAAVAIRAFVGREAARPARPAAAPAPPVDPVVDVTLPIKWPSSIVYGEGSIWVAASANDGTGGGTVYRIDPDTAEILAEIPSPVIPGWETGGGAMEVTNDSLWVAGGGSSRRLVRIDIATNRLVQEIAVEGQVLGDVAVDEHGVWVSVFMRDGIELVLLDPETGVEEARIPMESSYAREVLAVDGAIWLHERRTRGSDVLGSVLTRVDPETGRTEATVRLHGGAAMVTEAEGSIWVPTWSEKGGNLLTRVDPETGEVITLPSGTLEFVIDVGEGGVWGVARRGQDLFDGRGGIVRFDPVTGRVDAGVGIEAGTIALSVAPGSVWAAHYERGVTRVELRPA